MKAKSINIGFSVLPSWTKADSFAWQIWLLNSQGKSTRSALLYSWVTPATVVKNGWQPLETEYSKSIIEEGRTVKINLFKATYFGNSSAIQAIINQLLEGKSISETLKESDSTFPPNEFLNLTLGQEAAIAKNFMVRPEVFLAPEPLMLHWEYQAIPSPIHYGCWVKQIFNLNKTDHLLLHLADRGPDLQQLVKEIAVALRESTGFNLMESSAPRLGNIEWFHFPMVDQYLSSLVSFFVKKENVGIGKLLTLNIAPDPFAKEVKKIQIRCRLKNVQEVITDEIIERDWAFDPISVEFKANEAISKVLISIWEFQEDSQASNLIFEQEVTLLRDLGMTHNIVSTTIKTGRLKILDKLRRNEQPEKQKLMEYHRTVNSGEVRINDYDKDQWTPASQHIKSVMKSFFPEASKGRFFKSGWDESAMESGQLSFVKWLLETISVGDKCDVILIDPFLDSAAIELFSHARTINAHYTLFTCTQHRESPDADAGVVADAEPRAAEAIRTHCKSHEVLLQGLDIEIFDLRSKDGGKKQLFHDRYILIVDSAGSVIHGFHLSNSIQGATRSAPLLITPIPPDILPEVKEYVDSLVSTKMDASPSKGQTFGVQLFPEIPVVPEGTAQPSTVLKVLETSEASRMTGVLEGTQELFALLFNDPNVGGLNSNDLVNLLRKRKIISEDHTELQLFSLTVEELTRFAICLEVFEQEDFERLWSLWANLLANSLYWNEKGFNITDEWLKILTSRKSICSKLITLVSGYQKEKELITDRTRLFSVFQGEVFEELLEAALFKFLYFPAELFNLKYPLAYACKFLVYSFPADAIQTLEKLVKNLKECQWDESFPEIRAKMQLTNQLAYYLFGYRNRTDAEIQGLLLQSELVSLRAVSTCSLLFELRDQNLSPEDSKFEKTLDHLQMTLSDIEFRLSIAYLISCKNISYKADVNMLFQRLRRDWSGDLELIKRVATVLSGRLWGNHSIIIADEFLIPLSNAGHISSEYPFDYWNNIFKLKLVSDKDSKKDQSLSTAVQQHYDGFVVNTDIELTQCLIRLMGNLQEDNQCNAITEWIGLIQSSLQVVIQPFLQVSKYHLFDQSCTQLFWLDFILVSLQREELLHERSLEVIRLFRDEYGQEISLARSYILNRNHLSVEKLIPKEHSMLG